MRHENNVRRPNAVRVARRVDPDLADHNLAHLPLSAEIPKPLCDSRFKATVGVSSGRRPLLDRSFDEFTSTQVRPSVKLFAGKGAVGWFDGACHGGSGSNGRETTLTFTLDESGRCCGPP